MQIAAQVLPQSINSGHSSQVIVTAIAAALQPLRERLRATITFMQHTIESLQAELIAIREKEKDDVMTAELSADAKRFKPGSAT